ncbi:MAG: hypothetical protein H6Q42_2642 [Deltaproteobacteria bacterium]|nr:hypothetical protein [Deltaproteobacteria bacterium]
MKRTGFYAFILIIPALISLFSGQAAWSLDQNSEARPIEMGVSGGNINDLSRLYCCSGTLGALVHDSTFQYILSNNHVIAVTNQGRIGDDIIQPGLIDQSVACAQDAGDVVADLSKFVPLAFKKGAKNKVDAAIAQVRSGMVDLSGSILNIGQASSLTALPAIGLPVQKMGRTTGLTSGVISAVNVTANVSYNTACGIGSQTAKFTGQVMISAPGFSAGGDSGSLILEDCSPYPRAVGLLFAGSDTVTLANPIGDVLSLLKVQMVGADGGFCSSTASMSGQGSRTKAQSLPSQASGRAVEMAARVKDRHEDSILHLEGVVGLGIGILETDPEEAVIEVYTKKPSHEMKHVISDTLEGIPLRIVETGEIFAF